MKQIYIGCNGSRINRLAPRIFDTYLTSEVQRRVDTFYIVPDDARLEGIEAKCDNCVHVSTPRGKQCYTLSRLLQINVRDKGLPFYPEYVIPLLDSIGHKCKRYEHA